MPEHCQKKIEVGISTFHHCSGRSGDFDGTLQTLKNHKNSNKFSKILKLLSKLHIMPEHCQKKIEVGISTFHHCSGRSGDFDGTLQTLKKS